MSYKCFREGTICSGCICTALTAMRYHSVTGPKCYDRTLPQSQLLHPSHSFTTKQDRAVAFQLVDSLDISFFLSLKQNPNSLKD